MSRSTRFPSKRRHTAPALLTGGFRIETLEGRELLSGSSAQLQHSAEVTKLHAEALAHRQAVISLHETRVAVHEEAVALAKVRANLTKSLAEAQRAATRSGHVLLTPDLGPGGIISVGGSPLGSGPIGSPVGSSPVGGHSGLGNVSGGPIVNYDPGGGLYTPAQIRTAYGVSQLGVANEGQGVTIAIVNEYDQPNIVSDLKTFSTEFNLPQMDGVNGDPTFTVNQSQGYPGTSDGDWGIEESLDVEWAHAMAPMANIVLVEVNPNTNNGFDLAEQTAAGLPNVVVVSNSFGGQEGNNNGDENQADEQFDDPYFTTPAGHTPVAFFAASGDNQYPLYPALSPNVVAVGGTSLYTVSGAGVYGKEVGWSEGGGGVSEFEPTPTYQSANGVNYGHRAVPDISLVADPNTGVWVYDSAGNSGWLGVGGTSLSSPATAGIIALADQERIANGLSTFSTSTLNSELYGLYNSSSYTTYFNDVTTGNNGNQAGVGYDLVTGIGTPKANTLVPYLGSH